MRIAALQFNIVWQSPEENYRRIEPWVATAAGAGARVLLLPEMFAYGFSMDTARIAESPEGRSSQMLQQWARSGRLWVGGTVPEQLAETGFPYNTFVLAAPDGSLHRYRKVHPFTYANEHRHYAPGSELVTIDVEGLRCTLFVCYDLRFADEFWHTARTTDCYLVLANWPAARREHWKTLLRARAIENMTYVIGVNRVGEGGGLEYAGDSQIIAPSGELLCTAAASETMLIADVDPAVVAAARAAFPVLDDRRT